MVSNRVNTDDGCIYRLWAYYRDWIAWHRWTNLPQWLLGNKLFLMLILGRINGHWWVDRTLADATKYSGHWIRLPLNPCGGKAGLSG